MRASPPTQAAVQATLQQWRDAYSRRDVDGALAVIAPDDDVIGIGSRLAVVNAKFDTGIHPPLTSTR
jgi:ketosteroid isomerase-like protein